MLKRLFFFILFSMFLSAPSLASTKSVTDDVKGSLCVIRSDDKLVLVHELLTNKISLPGGTIIDNEPPKAAAQRETWEETGLVVTVGEELGRTNTAIYYDCISDSEIIAFSMNNASGGNDLPMWFAPHYGVEITSAMLLSPAALDSSSYRYPFQWPKVVGFFEHATQQKVSYVTQLIESAPSFRQIELEWMKNVQDLVATLSEKSKQIVNGLSGLVLELTNPTVMLFLFPLALMWFDSQFVYRLFFAICTTSLMVLVAQQGFLLPSPYVYMPMVGQAHSVGFSFPSLPIAVWFCVITFLLQKAHRLGLNRITSVIAILTSMVTLCHFFLGMAFILDMLFSALLGSLVAWHILRLDTNERGNIDQLLISRGVWMMITGLAIVISMVWPLPMFGHWIAILITATALVPIFKQLKGYLNMHQMLFVTLTLLLVERLYLHLASLWSFSGLWSFVFSTLHYPLLIMLYMLMSRKFSHENQQSADVKNPSHM